MAKKWIAGAIKHEGALTRQAKRKHKSVAAFEAMVRANPNKFSTTTKKRVALAKTLKGFKRK